jgi:hypothetical protein
MWLGTGVCKPMFFHSAWKASAVCKLPLHLGGFRLTWEAEVEKLVPRHLAITTVTFVA